MGREIREWSEVCSGPYARSGISSPFQRDDVERARVELSFGNAESFRLYDAKGKFNHHITPDTLVEEAVQLMHDNKIGCLPVLEEKKLYGIFTKTDALDLLVDIFGLNQKGTPLMIAFEDKPGAMLGVLEIFKKYKTDVISLVTPSFMVEGNRVAAVRIKTEQYKDIVKDSEKAGYQVLSIGNWPSP